MSIGLAFMFVYGFIISITYLVWNLTWWLIQWLRFFFVYFLFIHRWNNPHPSTNAFSYSFELVISFEIDFLLFCHLELIRQ